MQNYWSPLTSFKENKISHRLQWTLNQTLGEVVFTGLRNYFFFISQFSFLWWWYSSHTINYWNMDSHLHLKTLSPEDESNYSIAPFTFFSLCNFKCLHPLSDFKLIFSLKSPIFLSRLFNYMCCIGQRSIKGFHVFDPVISASLGWRRGSWWSSAFILRLIFSALNCTDRKFRSF